MTKKEQAMYTNYLYADNYSELWQVYGSYSHAKSYAMDYCKNLQHKKEGYNPKIVSHNSFIFTYAFEYEENGDKYLMYITPSYDYNFKIA